MRFRTYVDAGKVRLVAMLALPSGEVLHNLPVVDWVWRQFLATFMQRLPKCPAGRNLDAAFNRSVRARVMDSLEHFARIGLPRPKLDESKCWLMLDSLFPQPDFAWLDGI